MKEILAQIKINQNFQKSVNLILDIDDFERVGSYIPTLSSVAIMKRYLETVLGKSGESSTILIGPYGKGKSHLLLVLLNLLRQKQGELAEVTRKIEKIDPEAKTLLKEVKKQKKKYLPVLISTSQDNLNQAFLFALRNALVNEGLEEIAPDDYYTEALKKIQSWKNDFPMTYSGLEALLEDGSENHSNANYQTVNELVAGLKAHEKKAMQEFQNCFPMLTAGTKFEPIMQMEALQIYKQVNRTLIEDYGYSGIFIVFDEFSKYIEGHGIDLFASDMKVLQDMCELCNNQKDKMLISLVAHKSIHEYSKSIDASVKNAFRGVEGRIKEIEFVISAQTNYELISDTIIKKEPTFTEKFNELSQEEWFIQEVIHTYELPGFQKTFEKKEYEKTLVKGCFPLKPISSYALLHISEKVAQNERTIFTFLTDNAQGTLSWIMKKDNEHMVGTDRIYDYFKNLFKESSDQIQVHNEWMKAEYAISKAENQAEIQLIKTLAIIRMINRPDELPASEEVLSLATTLEKPQFQQAMASLKEKNLIIYRGRLGVYAFCANIGIDIEKEIDKRVSEISNHFELSKSIQNVSELEYELPKQYNQEYAITRYYQYVYMTETDFLNVKNAKYLFEESFSDGKILILLKKEEKDKNAIQNHLNTLGDPRIVLLTSNYVFDLEKDLMKHEAVEQMIHDTEFLEQNEVLLQELKLYEEDIAFELNAKIEKEYLPGVGQAEILVVNKEPLLHNSVSDYNILLSEIFREYYPHSPRVNHELLNIDSVGSQYLRARNQVVRSILDGEDCSIYLQGTKPEAMVYRAAFVHTEEDEGCKLICHEMEQFFHRCAGEKISFIHLYSQLRGRDYGARKGIIPLFLAKKLADAEGTAVVYLKNKELEITYETLNNVNEYPDKYELYIEPENEDKDEYLRKLEEIFCIQRSFVLSKQNRINGIVSCMQKWYRSLPQYVMVSSQFENEEKVSLLRNYLKRAELNPRELLFDKIPQIFGEMSYADVAEEIRAVKTAMDHKYEELVDTTATKILQVFGGNENANLKACLQEWSQAQRGTTKTHILGTTMNNFMNYVEALQTNDSEEIVRRIAHIVTDIYLEDWNDETIEIFQEDLSKLCNEIESIQEADGEEIGGNQLILKNSSGDLVEKYFDADITDSTSQYLKNMIDEALEDFGDTLEMNQKVAVLVKTIEDILASK